MDTDERRGRLGVLALIASAGLAIAAAFVTGPLAVALGIASGVAVAAGLAASFAHELGMDGAREGPRLEEPAIEPEPSLRLHVDAPPNVRRWLERIQAQANEAKRSR